jgi:Flp pilus assembly protein TadD
MRRIFGFLAGVVVGQWLVFGATLSPADLHSRAAAAYDRRDYVEALRLWSQAVSLQPAEARFHYLRGQALANLGMRTSAGCRLTAWLHNRSAST